MRPDVPEHVWIGEAYVDGERIERVVHCTEADARHDLEMLSNVLADAEVRIERERLYTGKLAVESGR